MVEQDDTNLLQMVNGAFGSSIKLFPDYIQVTADLAHKHKVIEIPYKDVLEFHYYPAYISSIKLSYRKDGKNQTTKVASERLGQPEFDSLVKRLIQMLEPYGFQI